MFNYFSRCLLIGLSCVACGGSEDSTSDNDEAATSGASDDDATPAQSEDAELAAASDAARDTYARIVFANYEDALELSVVLDERLSELVDAPSDEALTAARDAWRAAREPYLQSEVYRFYQGPIDNDEDGPEGAINAWPLDENYIDYVEGNDTAGIVNDPEREISAEALLALNEQGGEKNIATGFHAIEFLLWGQDLLEDGSGERPYTDYVTDGGSAANQDRRALYLTTVSSLLLTHLTQLKDAWSDVGSDTYRVEFEAAEPSDALQRILTGMIILSGFETGGERLQAALDTGEQEDEHSCFSDNTHRDMVQDVQGVMNVYRGSYERLDGSSVSGPSLRDVVEIVDGDLAQELDDQIEESLQLANALQVPFDREIALDNAAGRERVQNLIDALRAQEGLLQEVFQRLGLSIPEPP